MTQETVNERKNMKTDYKYIYFIKAEDDTEPYTYQVWWVYHNTTEARLGHIEWCEEWSQFVFCGEYGCFFSIGCMYDISHFIAQLKT